MKLQLLVVVPLFRGFTFVYLMEPVDENSNSTLLIEIIEKQSFVSLSLKE